jgi:alpha-N-acetylglucosamine transferase
MCSALVNVHRLQLVGASPLSEAVIIIPPGFEPLPAHKASAERLGVRLVRAPQLRGPTLTGYYADCMAKLYSFNLTEYARVVFLDADSVVLRPLDALFDLPDAAPLAAPRAYWLNPGKLKPNCGGVGWKASDGPQVGMQMKFTSAVMSLAPSAALWDRLSSKYFPNGTPKLDPGVFDMDLLNIEFKDEASLLRGEAVLALTGHWAEAARDLVPSAFQGKLTQDELWRLTRVVHFSPLKPWSGANGAARRANSNAHPHYYEAFQLWEASQKLVCG